MEVDENNVLLANPSNTEKEKTSSPSSRQIGYEVPLHLDDNGNVIIPTPAEIEEMIANGEGEYVGRPEDANHPPSQLTEEEWKMQEARRMI